MVDFFVFVSACAGAAAVSRVLVKDTKLNFKPLNCPLCMGFWFGIIFSRVFYLGANISGTIGLAFASAIWSWFIYYKITGEN